MMSSFVDNYWNQLGNRVGRGVQQLSHRKHIRTSPSMQVESVTKECKDDIELISWFLHGKLHVHERINAL
jgi:hypothetical protein